MKRLKELDKSVNNFKTDEAKKLDKLIKSEIKDS